MISEESVHLDEELTEAPRELRKAANGGWGADAQVHTGGIKPYQS